SENVGTHALPGDKTEAACVCRRRCRFQRALPRRNSRQAQIGVRTPDGISGLLIAVACLFRDAVAACASLLLDFVLAFGRSLSLYHYGRSGRGARELGARGLQRHFLELSRRPPRR